MPDMMEVVRAAVFLFAAGQDTSAKLLGNSLRFICESPQLQNDLRANPATLGSPGLPQTLNVRLDADCDPGVGDYDKVGADGRRSSRVRRGSGIRSLSLGWSDEYQHRFCIRNHYLGASRPGGLLFCGDPGEMALSRFAFQLNERFTYEYNFFDV